MTKAKLPVEDFHAQFHGHEHHKDPGEYTKPKHHLKNRKLAMAHKGLDLRALRNSKSKRPIAIHKDLDTMRLELTKRK